MSAARLPPGWPNEVVPAGEAGWERSATAWLLDQAPPEYRGYEVLRRHPVALAQLTLHQVTAALAGCRGALGAVRGELRDDLDPPALEAVLGAMTREEARLLGVQRAVRLVLGALRGERYVPRL